MKLKELQETVKTAKADNLKDSPIIRFDFTESLNLVLDIEAKTVPEARKKALAYFVDNPSIAAMYGVNVEK